MIDINTFVALWLALAALFMLPLVIVFTVMLGLVAAGVLATVVHVASKCFGWVAKLWKVRAR